MKSIKYNDARLNAKSLISMAYIDGQLHQTYIVDGEMIRFVEGQLAA